MKRVFKKALLGALTVGILAGCAGEEDTIVMAPLPQVDSQFTPSAEWSTSIGDGVGHYFSKLSPVVANDTLFVASRDGLVKALDPENGKLKWQTDLEEDVIARLSGGITAAYEHLYIGSENGEVIALDNILRNNEGFRFGTNDVDPSGCICRTVKNGGWWDSYCSDTCGLAMP